MYSAHALVMSKTAKLITNPRNKRNTALRVRRAQTELRDMEVPVCVRIALYFRRPKTHYDTQGKLRSTAPLYCCKRPDVDNYRIHLFRRVKYVLDAFQKAEVLKDDKFVVRAEVSKMWCRIGEERTNVELVLLR